MRSGSLRDAPLVLIPQYFGCLVFERCSSRYLPFDREATAVLRRLCQEPIEVVAGEESDGARRESLFALFDALHARGFVDLEGRLTAEVLAVDEVPGTHLVGPLAVHLEVIAACNLTCTHCFAGALPRNHHALRLTEMEVLFDELASMGAFRLGLTGGEPLLRKDLFDILDAASERGLHPCLTTNGLLIDERVARELGRRDMIWLNVSLDGASAATNDAVRGPGTFERVREKLEILRRHARFTLAFTITAANAHEVDACAALAAEVGAHTAVFRPLYPTGTALDHPELMPTYTQYADALERLARLELTSDHEICGVDPFSPQARAASAARTYRHAGCAAGNLICSISVQGQVNPCSFMGSAFDAGNIRDRPLREIWNDGHAFIEMRGPSTAPSCASGRFEGGCRARAQAANGSVHAADPWLAAYEARASGAVHPKSNLELDVERS